MTGKAPRTINQARLVRCSAGCGRLVWLAGALPVAVDATFVCPACTADPYTSAMDLCDPDGVVRRGVMHLGTDYPCTGHAHWAGEHIRCTTAIHRTPDEPVSPQGRVSVGATGVQPGAVGPVATCSAAAPAASDSTPSAGVSVGAASGARRRGPAVRPSQDAPTGVQLIRFERERQVKDEGYTPAHDAEQIPGHLIAAAWCYLGDLTVHGDDFTEAEHFEVPDGWPWEAEAWKPTPDDDVRQLVKAGALIAAEIDRLIAGRGHA